MVIPALHRPAAGMTLVEVAVAVGVLIVAFLGMYNLFYAGVRYVTNASSREAALSLATERMEQLRALSYTDLGTVGGIPSGTLAQQESIALDNVTFTRRTLIQYVDDPTDGTGASDANLIAADYKRAKVTVSWTNSTGTSSVSLVSNFIQGGVETNAGGGTLSISTLDALGAPLSGATVRILQPSANPAVDVTVYTNSAGTVFFPGTPVSSGYQIIVTKSGYSTAQTYTANGSNPNPNPGHLTIVAGQTTSATFAIDRLVSLMVRTFALSSTATTTDTFSNSSGIASSSAVAVSGGSLRLTQDGAGAYGTSGVAYENAIQPSTLSSWSSLSWNKTTPANTSILVRVYQVNGGVYTLLPDSDLSGNSAGFSTSPISLSALSTSTYPSLTLGATLASSDASSTPQLLDWSLSYVQGATPLPSMPFSITGTKTIGTAANGSSIYKVSQTLSTDSTASYATSTLEWDSYTLSVASTTGWDTASVCPFQPFSILPGASSSADFYLVTHTQHTLLLHAVSAASGASVAGATVSLSRSGFSAQATTDSCGNAFFSNLTSASNYAATITASGFTTKNLTNISVSNQTTVSTSL